MWTIPLFMVRNALALKAHRVRARAALNRAIQAADGNHVLETAIRQAVIEAELLCMTMQYAGQQALSGAERRA